MRKKGKRLNQYVPDYVVFDLETTGIHQERDAIIEISAVRVCGGKIVAEYSTLVNPKRHIPAGATAVNGITDEMVQGAPDIGEAIAGFMDFIGNGILVGHNIHTFDMNFACSAAWQALGRELDNSYIDTLYMARYFLPQLPHHRLTDVAEYFHIDTEGAHRALKDCLMNQQCFEELGKLWEKQKKEPAAGGKAGEGSMECPRCGGMLYLRKGKFGMFYGCGNFPACRYTRNA